MGTRTATVGALFATLTALAWGGQFVVGKSALGTSNAFPLTTLRYAVAAGLWLARARGPSRAARSLRLDGRGRRLFWLGTLGFAGFNLLAYTGLAHARPQSASLIVALGPLLTALVLWQRTKVRPTATTLALLGIALVGVALVISGGHPASLVDGSVGWGDALVLGGVLSFVLYSLGASEFRDFSPLRYTALTAVARLALARRRDGGRARDRPRPAAVGGELWSVTPQIAYLAIPARSSRCSPGTPRSRGSARRTRSFRQPDSGDDVRDRDRARLPAGRRRARRRRAHDRRARREQPARAPPEARTGAGARRDLELAEAA